MNDVNEMIKSEIQKTMLGVKFLGDFAETGSIEQIMDGLFDDDKEKVNKIKEEYKEMYGFEGEVLDNYYDLGIITEKIKIIVDVCMHLKKFTEKEVIRKQIANYLIGVANELNSIKGDFEFEDSEGGEE